MRVCVCVRAGGRPLAPSPGPARAALPGLPLGVEVHYAHNQDLLSRPHSSFDVPAEGDDLERTGGGRWRGSARHQRRPPLLSGGGGQ